MEEIKLTKRELEILSKVAVEGVTYKEIADSLFVSKRTIDFHMYNIFNKLGVHNRIAAIQRAIQLGILPAKII